MGGLVGSNLRVEMKPIDDDHLAGLAFLTNLTTEQDTLVTPDRRWFRLGNQVTRKSSASLRYEKRKAVGLSRNFSHSHAGAAFAQPLAKSGLVADRASHREKQLARTIKSAIAADRPTHSNRVLIPTDALLMRSSSISVIISFKAVLSRKYAQDGGGP